MSDVSKMKTPEFRAAFPFLFKPRKGDDGRETFEVLMGFERTTDLTGLKQLCAAAIQATWPNGVPKDKRFESPFKDGADKAKWGLGDYILARAWTKQRPAVFADGVEVIDPAIVYPGCYGEAIVNAFTYQRKEKNGVSIGLLGFRKTRDGAPFIHRASLADFGDMPPAPAGAAAPALKAADPMAGLL